MRRDQGGSIRVNLAGEMITPASSNYPTSLANQMAPLKTTQVHSKLGAHLLKDQVDFCITLLNGQ